MAGQQGSSGTPTRKAVVRPRKKSAAAKVAEDPWAAPLDSGDKIELSVTAEVKNRQGRSFWVKGGAVTTVRPGESPASAKERLTGFVAGYVDEQINEYLG